MWYLAIVWVIPGALKHRSSFTQRGQAVFDYWISISFSVPKIYLVRLTMKEIWKYDLSELETTQPVAQCHIPEELNPPWRCHQNPKSLNDFHLFGHFKKEMAADFG